MRLDPGGERLSPFEMRPALPLRIDRAATLLGGEEVVDDAIDVWYDDHLGSEDSCEDDREPADSVLAEDRAVAEDIRREMTIDEYRS